MSSLVSIGIPTYNHVAGLERAVASVLAQTHRELELVISDNASTDTTPELCARVAAGDARVRIMRQPHNRGPTENFNAVLAELRGEHTMLLADDDTLEPEFVERCRVTFVAEPDLSIVHGRTCFADATSEMLGTDFDVTADDPGRRVLDYLGRVHDNGAFYGLVRGDAMRAALPVPNMLGADWAWVSRLAFQGAIRVQHDTQLRRSYGGVSRSVERIAQILGLPPGAARRPTATIVANIHNDIRQGSAVYGALSPARRRRLAAGAALAVARSHPSNFIFEELRPLLSRPLVARALGPLREGLDKVRAEPRPGKVVQRDGDAASAEAAKR